MLFTPASAVIFDMDGLMLNTERIGKLGWQQAARDFGFEISDELFAQAIGRLIQDTKKLFCTALGPEFPFDEVRQVRREYGEKYIAQHGLDKMPGLDSLLEFIDQIPIKKAVATSTYREPAEKSLKNAGLLERFPVLATGDEVSHGKPAPDIFLLAAKRLNQSPEMCVVLEDSELGIQAAHKAGMKSILVPDLITPSLATKKIASHILPSLNEVHSLLAKSLG